MGSLPPTSCSRPWMIAVKKRMIVPVTSPGSKPPCVVLALPPFLVTWHIGLASVQLALASLELPGFFLLAAIRNMAKSLRKL